MIAMTGGAHALGMGAFIDSLEIGKRVDTVLFDPNKLKSIPMHYSLIMLAHSSSNESIGITIVDGNVVYRRDVSSCGADLCNVCSTNLQITIKVTNI